MDHKAAQLSSPLVQYDEFAVVEKPERDFITEPKL
jgi:hypothetical protein